MTEAELSSCADTNYFDWWRVWASAVDCGEVREQDGMLIAATGAPQEWWNIAFVTKRLDNPDESIRQAIAHFDSRKQAFILRVREGIDPASERTAEANGLPYTDTIPGMVLRPIPSVEERRAPLEIRTVSDPQTLDHYVRVVSDGFHMSVDQVRNLLPMRLIEHPRWRSYVGYADGQPVATAALLITDGVAGIHWVATVQGYRRRGFGEAMTWHAIGEGEAAGCQLATLQSSDMGRPIYERMGFRFVAGYKTFVRPDQ